MKRALRFPSRWAGWWRTLAITAALSARARRLHVHGQPPLWRPRRHHGVSRLRRRTQCRPDLCREEQGHGRRHRQRYGVPRQTIVDRNRLQPPYPLRAGQTLEVPGAKYVPPTRPVGATQRRRRAAAAARSSGRRCRRPAARSEGRPRAGRPPPASRRRSARPPRRSRRLPPAPTPRFQWPLRGKIVTPYGTTPAARRATASTSPPPTARR